MPRKSPAPDAEHQNKEPRRRAKRAAAPASSEEAAMAVPTPELQPEPTAPELIAPELAEPRLAEPALPPTEPAEPAPAEPPRVEGPGIWIELDSGVPFGLSDDRFDIWLRGRVLSTDPVVEVRLLADERLFSATAYGHPEGMMIAATPNAAPTWQVGFQLNLPRPRHGAAGASDFRILARTETGQEHVQDYTLDFNPDTGHGVLVSGPTNPALAHTPARPHAIVYIERAMLDQDGVLSVSGWALAMRPILALQVHADEERVGDARFGERREDVAAAHPSFPNARQSGFSLVCTLDPLDINAACVRVQVVCRDGFGQTVVVPIHRVTERLRPAIAPAAVPKAETAAEPPTPVFNLLNQKPAYSLQTDFRIAEEPVIGFVLTTPALRAAAADAPARPETQKPEAPKPEAPKPSTEIRMFCDAVSLSGDGVLDVSGWAVCGIGIAQVRVLFDDETAGLAVYGHDRNDVGSAFPEIPHAMMSGFTFRQRVANRTEGEHTVRVIVRNLTGGEKEETLLTTATATRAAADLPLSSAPGEPTASTMATIEADSFVPTAEQEREF
ncbi:MAG TPA: hypothetical protein VHB27_12945, partial [Rhodopila sp.]|nr:hypothetical protein [Rhodopila sp.]